MSTALTFAFQGQNMRVVMIDDEPWWVAADLCTILDLRNPTMVLKKLDDDQVTLNLIEGEMRGKPVNCVSESGMWMLVFRSDKPQAVELRRFLSREVLPSLRKTGFYEMPGFEPPPIQAMDMDPVRLAAGVSVVRLAMRLYGPMAARGLWLQVGLPPVVADSEVVFDGDPLAAPLSAWLADRAECTISQAAEGIGLGDIDWSTRFRIGKLLARWGWTAANRRVTKYRTARVFTRPASLRAEVTPFVDAQDGGEGAPC